MPSQSPCPAEQLSYSTSTAAVVSLQNGPAFPPRPAREGEKCISRLRTLSSSIIDRFHHYHSLHSPYRLARWCPLYFYLVCGVYELLCRYAPIVGFGASSEKGSVESEDMIRERLCRFRPFQALESSYYGLNHPAAYVREIRKSRPRCVMPHSARRNSKRRRLTTLRLRSAGRQLPQNPKLQSTPDTLSNALFFTLTCSFPFLLHSFQLFPAIRRRRGQRHFLIEGLCLIGFNRFWIVGVGSDYAFGESPSFVWCVSQTTCGVSYTVAQLLRHVAHRTQSDTLIRGCSHVQGARRRVFTVHPSIKLQCVLLRLLHNDTLGCVDNTTPLTNSDS